MSTNARFKKKKKKKGRGNLEMAQIFPLDAQIFPRDAMLQHWISSN